MSKANRLNSTEGSPRGDRETASAEPQTRHLFRDVERSLGVFLRDGAETRALLAAARRRAEATIRGSDSGPRAARLGAVNLVADVLSALSVEHGWRKRSVDKLVRRISELTDLPEGLVRSTLHCRAAWNPDLIALPPRHAIESQVRMLHTLAGVSEVSLWQTDGLGKVECVFRIGEGEPTRRVRASARRTLLGTGGPAPPGGLVVSIPVLRWQRPRAALAIRTTREDRPFALFLAEQTAAALGPVFEREALLDRSEAKERALVDASERWLTRLGFDLHDGPIQELAFLAGDVALFRSQLAGTLDGGPDGHRLLGRLEDLHARVESVDAGLRMLVHSLEAPALGTRPLPAVLEDEVAAVRRKTDIEPTLELSGDFSTLTPSQRIALVRIVQEAIANIREHSRATALSISVTSRRDHVHALIRDNGRGFNVERAVVRAARKGRLGLLGMSERVRLLGGHFDIVSKPGEGTEISVSFPPWQPVAREAEASGRPLRAKASGR